MSAKKIITLTDWYIDNLTCNVRVSPIPLDADPVYPQYTHCAILTEGQIAKVYKELPNGCRELTETRQSRDGRVIEAVIYFDMI